VAAALALALTALGGCLDENDRGRSVPEIVSINADPAQVYPGDTSVLTVEVSDCGCREISYQWSASAGWFPVHDDREAVLWLAPETAGVCSLAVRVSDGISADSVSLVIEVLEAGTPVWTYTIVDSFPHDNRAFTQGLLFANGLLYEGTGLTGASSLREVVLETGDVLRIHPLAANEFGEGITLLDERIYQITWQNRRGYVYERATFAPIDTFGFTTVTREGWGLTDDGERLILSDGSHRLYFYDPLTYAPLDTVEVFDAGARADDLNELEYIDGLVYANVWHTERIAQISPQTGTVVAWIDLTGLRARMQGSPGLDVLNGIAHDPGENRLFVTGKRWPWIYEIRLQHPPERPGAAGPSAPREIAPGAESGLPGGA
jgi:glutamine cyclotransferase